MITGGNVKSRMRLLNDILDEASTIWPAYRLGVRLSPENCFNCMSDSNPQKHFEYFAEQLGMRDLAYLHMLEGEMLSKASVVNYSKLRSTFAGIYIAVNGYDLKREQAALDNSTADLVAVGIPFLANPDLVCRCQENLPLNDANFDTFYGGDETGYTDYPAYGQEQVT